MSDKEGDFPFHYAPDRTAYERGLWRDSFSIVLAIAVMFVITVLVLYACSAQAHEAPSGWLYPQDCCAEGDCHPVSCEELHEVEGGVGFLSYKFTGAQIRPSKDGYCHVCIGIYGPLPNQHKPHCVFMTPRT